ncbi:hypothetical protein [Enterobacter ludwigii]|uniref:hypothetical protein n=1 Tax=Enterobacter ludwigii TaxID=299767 RepID=UPI002FD77A15
MSNIDKQWLQQKIAEMESAQDEIPFGLGEDDSNTLAALRIALASLETEAVAWRCGSTVTVNKPVVDDWKRRGFAFHPLYTAPPAPSVYEDLLHMAASAIDDLLSNKDRSGAGVWADIPAKLHRSAMLQGADGNSPVIPDGAALVPVQPTAEMLQSGIAAHYERSQIQIHDRPAPGPMECAYAAMIAAAPQQEVKNG